MEKAVEIRIPGEAGFLKVIRCALERICAMCAMPEETAHAVVLAVDEAAANIIKHTYGGRSSQPIIVRALISEDHLKVVLRDFGPHADPRQIKSRKLEDVRPGGLGVHFIQSTMDRVEFDNTLTDGNELTLIKNLPVRKGQDHDQS